MEIERIRLMSENKSKHFNKDEEERQEIELDTSGHLIFRSYKPKVEEPIRMIDTTIEVSTSLDIISKLEDYFHLEPSWSITPGLGNWRLVLVDKEGKEYSYYGSQSNYHRELSVYIQERLKIEDLCLFGH